MPSYKGKNYKAKTKAHPTPKKKAQPSKSQRKKQPVKAHRGPKVTRTNTLARVSGLYDIDNRRPIPVPRSLGTCTMLPDQVRYTWTQAASGGYRRIFILTHTGHASTMGIRLGTNGSGVETGTFELPMSILSATAGGPTSGRALRNGIYLSNTTPKLNAGGRVVILKTDQRIVVNVAVQSMVAADVDALCTSVVNHPDAVDLDGNKLADKAITVSNTPVDLTKYEAFRKWRGSEPNMNDFGEHALVWSGQPTDEDSDRPMSTIFVVFEIPPNDQTYTAIIKGASYHRWPLASPMSLQQRPLNRR